MLEVGPVAAWDTGAGAYPQQPPFHPGEAYPEYPFAGETGTPNPVYAGVRQLLAQLDLATGEYGSANWSPLGRLVQPGNTVIIKPNFVISEHPLGQAGIEAAVVHGSVLRPLIDYVYLALQGRGRIVVADSPIKEVDFDRIVELTGIAGIKAFYDQQAPGLLELLDFRDAYVRRNSAGFMMEWTPLPGDPTGYTPVNLGPQSMFHEIAAHRHRLRSTAVYYEDVMEDFHGAEHNVYSVPNTLLNADVVMSVAKLKTHRKGGITLTLKNAVGITNEKRGLPHHRVGSPHEGGDAVPDNVRLDARLEDNFRDFMLSHSYGRAGLRLMGPSLRTMSRVMKPVFRRLAPSRPSFVEGDWYGNDTVWRMALDLNHVLFYAKPDGSLAETPQRRYLGLVDGIVAGEREGPLFPDPKTCGILLAGTHPLLIDLVATRLMGFNWQRVPMLREGLRRDWPLRPRLEPADIQVRVNRADWGDPFGSKSTFFGFEPTAGWKGHIEVV